MNKNVLFAGLAVLGVFQAGAQHAFNWKKHESRNAASIYGILNRQWAQSSAQKPTGLRQRVIAQGLTDINGPDIYLDSLIFRYSGSNGSTYNYNQIGYNDAFEPNYAPMHIDPRYTSDPMNLLADTIIYYSDGELNEVQRAFYRPDNKIDSVFRWDADGSGLSLNAKNLVRYNPLGNIDTIQALEGPGGALDPYSVQAFHYNAGQTRVEADTTFFPFASGTFIGYKYTYNASSGRLDTFYSTFQGNPGSSLGRVIYDYYSDGKLRKTTQQFFDNGTWETDSYDSIGYTPGMNYYTYWMHTSIFFDGSQNIEQHYLTVQYPGANGLPDSAIDYIMAPNSSQWVPETRLNYTYNSYGNPVKLTATSLEGGEPEPRGYMNFYYETYDDGLAIRPVTDNDDFTVYPNPFSKTIHIDRKGNPAGDVVVRLMTITGQEVFKTTLQPHSGANNISLPELPGGNYILLLQDAEGRNQRHKMVKK